MKTLGSLTSDPIVKGVKDSKTRTCEGFMRLGEVTWLSGPTSVDSLVCPDCNTSTMMVCRYGQGWIDERDRIVAFCCEKSCLKRALEKKNIAPVKPIPDSWKPMGIPGNYETKSFENLNNMPMNVISAKSFIKSDSTCLTLQGESGSGKTHCAVALLKEFHMVTGKPVVFIHISDLLSELRECQSTNTNEYRVIQKYADYPFLVIDDLGSTRGTDWQVEKTRELIQKRIGLTKTVITTNYSFDHLENTYGIIFMRRLSDSSSRIQFVRKLNS